MNRDELRERLYQKYIAPTLARKGKFVGIEIEMPVANLEGRATDYAVAQAAAAKFRERFGFVEEARDVNGVCYSATCPATGDNLSFDCAYNNMELSFGKATSLAEPWARFQEYVAFLNGELARHGHLLTGMGVNPNRELNRKDYIPSERYRMLERYLQKFKDWDVPLFRYHGYPDYAAFCSASQVQLDVACPELLETLHVNALAEPLKAVLFSNSVLPTEPSLLCVRDMMWEHSTHGINPHNIGAFEAEPESVDDLLEYILGTSIFCTMRGGRYVCFYPVPVAEYFALDAVTGETFNGEAWEKITFKPEAGDLKYLRTYKFEDLTFRGTIEFRSACSQPFSSTMSVAAFHMGLKENSKKILELLRNDKVLYHHGYSASELRKILNKRTWPNFIERSGLTRLCLAVLDLAGEGLKKLGQGDERFLEPLYRRAETLTSPARHLVDELEKGVPMRELVLEFAKF